MSAPFHILITGFEPFEQDSVNPSWQVAQALHGSFCDGATVNAVQLPCAFGRAVAQLDQALHLWQPQLVLALGLAGGRSEVSLERVAINVDDARIADNVGQQPIDIAVVDNGPAAYLSTLPIKAVVRDLRAAGLPGAVSNTAGTFVCNHVFYALMHRLASEPAWSQTRGGFIHLPYLPEQAARHPGAPSMALAIQVQALQVVMRTTLAVRVDVRKSASQLH